MIEVITILQYHYLNIYYCIQNLSTTAIYYKNSNRADAYIIKKLFIILKMFH